MEIVGVVLIVVIIGLFVFFNKLHEQDRSSEAVGVNAEQRDSVETSQGGVSTAEGVNQTKQEVVKPESVNLENNVMEEKKRTRDLFLETLTKIGCQYEIDESEGEDGDIRFGYQGEYFVVRATNKALFIQIYDTHWAQIELYDIDDFARLKKAINESNINNSVTTVYTINEAGSTVDVHSKSTILFVPEIPNIDEYLRFELREYFRVHESISLELARQREAEGRK